MQSIKRRMIPLALSAIMALSSQVYAKATPIDIVAQPLASALTQFAEQAHVQVLVSQELVSGKVAPEVRGELEPIDALKALLKNSGLEAVSQNGTLVIKKVEKAQEESLEKITMKGQAAEGSVEAGYRIDTVSKVGPWGERELQDTPYSINVMSSDLLDNMQIHSTADLFKYNPYTQVYIPTARIADNINMRGFYNNSRLLNGLQYNGVVAVEDKERVEVLTGATGFMNGISSPAGTINYVMKRPTKESMASVDTGCREGSDCYAHADISGPLTDDGRVGYRVNVVKEGGETFVADQKINKWLITGALDYRVTDNLKLEFDASSYYNKTTGMQIGFNPSTGNQNNLDPNSIDPRKQYGQDWSYEKDSYNLVDGKLTWDINNWLTLRSAAMYNEGTSERLNINAGNIDVTTRTYTENIYHIFPSDLITKSAYTYLDAKFDTGSISHKITTGFSLMDYESDQYKIGTYFQTGIGITSSLDNPVYTSQPSYANDVGDRVRAYTNTNKNIMLGDEVTFNDQWSMLLGINNTHIDTISYNTTTQAITSEYDKSASTPTVSLLYKPIPSLTLYTTYLEALEQGGTAPATYLGNAVHNTGEILSPMLDKQYEVGAKTNIGGLFLTGALFQIDKANQYVDPSTLIYAQDGRQVHKGIEFTATGSVTDNFRLYGGASYLNATIKEQANNTALEGKHPTNVPSEYAKIIGEYDIDAIHGLTLIGGAFYTGSTYQNALNTVSEPSVVTEDIGARYTTKMGSYPTVFRFNVSNITDKHYWVGNILGDPRIFSLSVQMKF
ncbi:Ferrichrome receptor FcuA [Sulfurospirillum diekertiae]|uniref:Ferrichrome receptor FcuA n=1 Tax=Sulfurospirillum diekertiae TaxID=1854492 RepID=A0A290HEU1_9BACT|nr:TonB-dependent receptor [Sulfurospirillum diekertiae]ATB70072.1 Ferrichrome receptor FcuA [Sulfurospirillum diekertiae]